MPESRILTAISPVSRAYLLQCQQDPRWWELLKELWGQKPQYPRWRPDLPESRWISQSSRLDGLKEVMVALGYDDPADHAD